MWYLRSGFNYGFHVSSKGRRASKCLPSTTHSLQIEISKVVPTSRVSLRAFDNRSGGLGIRKIIELPEETNGTVFSALSLSCIKVYKTLPSQLEEYNKLIV